MWRKEEREGERRIDFSVVGKEGLYFDDRVCKWITKRGNVGESSGESLGRAAT